MAKEFFLLAGKSGSGKNYMANAFGLEQVCSSTTRPIRISETEGKEHWFVRPEDYKWQVKSNFVAYTKFNGYHYWASFQDLNGKDVYIIDKKGILYFKEQMIKIGSQLDYKVIYLDISWMKSLYRMINRGDEFIKAFKRMIHDVKAFKGIKKMADVIIKV